MSRRRTNPGFLSDDEAAREARRTKDVVSSIVGKSTTDYKLIENRRPQRKFQDRNSNPRPFNLVSRVGKTESFFVDFDRRDKQIAVYGREIPWGYPFKLRFGMSEAIDIACLLEKATLLLGHTAFTRIGETKNFIVDYDSNLRLVMVYRKLFSEYRFKLAFNQSEITGIISIFRKARTKL